MRTRSDILPKQEVAPTRHKKRCAQIPLPLEDASTPEGFDYSMLLPSVALLDLLCIEGLDLGTVSNATCRRKFLSLPVLQSFSPKYTHRGL